MNLPPVRPSAVVAQAPPESRGLGFGGFFLALLLLAGVLGLVYLGATGFFSDLFTFTTGAASAPTSVVGPTAEPTAAPTAVPMGTVPDLAGKTSQEAFAAVQAAGLTPREDAPRFDDVISTGLVLDQFPTAGTQITDTAVVTYAVSLGPALLDVPDVQRAREADARARLEGAGFQVQVQQEPNPTVPKGFVARQDPVGVRLPRGQTVMLFISLGDVVTMPDVTGLSEEDAKQQISAAGLTWTYSDPQGCDKLGQLCDRFAPGQVVSSIPRGGDVVPRGTDVTLGVRAP
jgi:serine/threonine-protein kinase